MSSQDVHERDLRNEPPTIEELRGVMDDVRHEIDNTGQEIFAQAHALLRWLVDEYLWSTAPADTRDALRQPHEAA